LAAHFSRWASRRRQLSEEAFYSEETADCEEDSITRLGGGLWMALASVCEEPGPGNGQVSIYLNVSKKLDERCVLLNTLSQELTPKVIQGLLDEVEVSRASRKRAWENLQEIRWVLQDSAGMKLPPPARKTIDLEGRVVKDGVRKAITDRQNALHELVNAINQYRKLSESKPLTLQGSDYAHAVQELNKAIDQADGLLLK
jgi:hypothetical protein